MSQRIEIAHAMVDVLIAARPNGITASEFRNNLWVELGYSPTNNSIQDAAKYLRDHGVPLVAQRAAENSRWMIGPPGTIVYDEWVKGIIRRFYSEARSAYRALYPNNSPAIQPIKSMLFMAAQNSGLLLKKDHVAVIDDLQPTAIHPSIKGPLVAAGIPVI